MNLAHFELPYRHPCHNPIIESCVIFFGVLDEKWIGNVLTSNPVIVKHLMRFLTAKQLSRAVVVCSLWRECALKEKLRRFEIQQFGFVSKHTISIA